MADPMTPERRAEIREAARPGYADILAQLIKHGAHDDPKHGKVIVHGVTVVPAADLKAAVRVVWFGAPALLVEVERLRKALHNGRAELCAVQIDRDQWRDRAHRLKVERDEALAALAQITAAAQRAALSDDPAPILYTALQAVERDDAQRRLESDLRELVVLRRDVGAVQAERDEVGAEVERLRAELADTKQERDDYAARFRATDSEYAEHLKRAEKVKAELATVLKNYEGLQGMAIRLEGERDEARVKLAKDHDELRDRRTDDLDIRGILKPAPGVGDPAVPMPLGPALAPAIEWLVNDRDRLRLQLESAEQERDAARGVAKGRTELADQMRTERDEAREQVKRVEALRDRWEATVRDPTIYRNGGIEHAAALAASHLPELRRALGGTEASAEPPDIETRVHAFFADADQRGVHLDGMTVDELCDAVMAAIRKGPGR